jgi:hypothetical protein
MNVEAHRFKNERCCLVSPDYKFLFQSPQRNMDHPPPRFSFQLVGGPQPSKMSAHAPVFVPVLHLAQLREQIDAEISKGLTQSGFIQHWLRRGEIDFPTKLAKDALRNAICVGLDAEWYEYDSTYITELGISIMDPNFVQDFSSPYGPLRSMVTHHVRIKENAHLINWELCRGYPAKFQFGATSFADMEQTRKVLRDAFIRYDTHGHLRPVIFVGHAVDNDVKMIKERFDLDIERLGVVVATVDTQVLADEAELTERKVRLTDLLGKFEIEEKYLHNAGNDIVCTMVAALVMQFPEPLFVDHGKAYADLKVHHLARPSSGEKVFCIRCNSPSHFATECQQFAQCTICASYPDHSKNAGTHPTAKCPHAVKNAAIALSKKSRRRSPSPPKTPSQSSSGPVTKHAVPCCLCIESTDQARYSMKSAYGHKDEECPFRPG